jgi:hypothetical protein
VPDGQTISVATCILDGNTGGLSCTGKQYALDTGAEVEGSWRDFTGARKYSPDGSWMLSGAELQHFSTQHRNLATALTATTFAPNGDIFGGDREGRLFRFCHSELP